MLSLLLSVITSLPSPPISLDHPISLTPHFVPLSFIDCPEPLPEEWEDCCSPGLFVSGRSVDTPTGGVKWFALCLSQGGGLYQVLCKHCEEVAVQ